MSDKHGPDAECADCHFCPTCGGLGVPENGADYEVTDYGGYILGCCRECHGEGVLCPNYEATA